MKKYFSPINIIFTAALSLVVLIAFNIVPREGAFVFLLLYVLFVLFYPVERGVDLFLRSIPFFIALPITESFDNFNIWRIILALLFVKWFFVEYDWKKWIRFKFDRVQVKKFIKENKTEFAGIVFLLFSALSVFVGPDTTAGIKRFIFILNAVMLFIVIRALIIKNKDNAAGFAKNLAYSGILAVLFGYLQFISAYFVPAWVFHYWWGQIVSVAQYGQAWGDITTNFGNTWFSYSAGTLRLRMFSTFPDSHSFPMYVIMTFPALFLTLKERFDFNLAGWVRHATSRSTGRSSAPVADTALRSPSAAPSGAKPAFGPRATTRGSWLTLTGLLAALNLALILSGTRGIWLASVATLFVVGLLKFLKIDKKYNRVMLASLLIFLLMFPLYFGIVSFRQFQDTEFDTSASLTRIRSIIDFGETSNQGRIFIWKKSVEYIAHSPVLGVGIGNYPIVLNEPQSASEAGASAHNLYLHIAATMGIPALLAFLYMVFEFVRMSIAYLKKQKETGYGLYFAMFLFSLAWVGAYLMTDAALYDGRALLGFMAMTAIAAGLFKWADADKMASEH